MNCFKVLLMVSVLLRMHPIIKMCYFFSQSMRKPPYCYTWDP